MSDPGDEPAADVISSGGEGFGMFVASRWARLMRLVSRPTAGIRRWRTRTTGVIVLAGAVLAALTAAALLIPASHPPVKPVPAGEHIAITNTTAGFVGPDGWVGTDGCRRGRACPTGLPG